MHIVVDAANLPRDRRGIGRYVRAMLSRWLDARDVRLTLVVPDLILLGARRRLVRALGRDDLDVRRRKDVRAVRPDLVWYPWNGMTWTSPCASVATVHDVWPFVSPADDVRMRRREQLPYLTMIAQSSAVIVNSHFTKSEIQKYLAVGEGRIHVVHMGVDMPHATGINGPKDPLLHGAQRYVLFVGESEPRKDLATLCVALQRLPADLRRSTGLVAVGKTSRAKLRGRIELKHTKASQVLLLQFASANSVPRLIAGEVSEARLDQLYAGADVLAFPSRYEGFGLPLLEAMARGVPVVASDAASIPEVAADAALYFPAGDPEALASVLARLLRDPALAQDMRAAGLTRAAELSWDRCSEETLRVFRQVIGAARA